MRGHILPNCDDTFAVDIGTKPYDVLEQILAMFEHANEHRWQRLS